MLYIMMGLMCNGAWRLPCNWKRESSVIDRGMDADGSVPLQGNTNLRKVKNDHSTKRGPILFLHVGPHKTGTTTIQHSLNSNSALTQDRYEYLGKHTSHEFKLRKLLTLIRHGKHDLFFEKLGELLRPKFEANTNVILSAEEFSYLLDVVDVHGKPFFRRFKEEVRDWQVYVAVGYRRQYEWIASFYNQRHRTKNYQEPFVSWYRDNSPFQNNCHHVYSVMKDIFPKVSVINVHSQQDLMTNMFCNILPNATHACSWNTQQQVVAASNHNAVSSRQNPSVPLWPRALVENARQKGFPTVREEHVVDFANKINYTLPFQCISRQEEEQILQMTLEYEKYIVPDFFESSLGEVELRKDFHKALELKRFCSVNTSMMLDDEIWLRFFANQQQPITLT